MTESHSHTDIQSLMENKSSWFAALSDDCQQLLLRECRHVTLPQKQYLFHRGDGFDGIYAMISGTLWISGLDITGKEIGLTVIEPGEWFGEIALFDQAPRTHDVVALQPCEILHLPTKILNRMVEEDPLWWQRFGKLMTLKLRLLFQNIEDRSMPSALIRLARRLLTFCQQQEGQLQAVEIAIPQEQLGQLLSLSRQKTNTLLRELEQQQILSLTYGKIVLTHPDKLIEIAFPRE